jgi:histidine triad (HIT) family protein
MSDCLFCKIAAGEIAAQKVHEDEDVVAFRDIRPQAPVHVLVVPRKHVASLDAAADADAGLLGRLLLAVRRVARDLGVADGYRVVTNNGGRAGQSVFHLHFHVLGGRTMDWPPG